jgi:hypothetical protein
MIDQHIHTKYSDGHFTPKEILEKLIGLGCKLFSITDHDGIQANREILDEIEKNNYDINFLTGVEISSVFEGRNVHLLCYNFHPENPTIIDMVERTAELRKDRMRALIAHLREKHNIVISKSDTDDLLQRRILGKPHIYALVRERNLTTLDMSPFIDKHMEDMPSQQFKLPAEDVLEIIHNAGGCVSLAHPLDIQEEYKIDFDELDKFIGRLAKINLDMLEVYHSSHNEVQVKKYKEIAKKYNLMLTAGSDFHGIDGNEKLGVVTNYGLVLECPKGLLI